MLPRNMLLSLCFAQVALPQTFLVNKQVNSYEIDV